MSDCRYRSLLPNNRTPLEEALEETLHQKHCNNDTEIISALQDPWKCPVEFLPWLAYAYNVDVWSDKWPENTKRAVIANSHQTHKNKGTIGGLKDSLTTLGVRVEIIEWFDMQPVGERGTMQLTLWVNDNINPDSAVMVNSQTIRDILDTVNSNKRHSIHYTFRLGVESNMGIGIAMSAQTLTHQRIDAKTTTKITPSRGVNIGMAMSAQTLTHQRIDAKTTTKITPSRGVNIGMAMSAQTITMIRVEGTL